MKELRKIQATPENSILVIVDMQKGDTAVDRNPYWWVHEEAHPELSTRTAIVPAVARLLERAREAGVRVIHVQSSRTHLEREIKVFGSDLTHKIGSWDSEIFDELMPEPREIVVRKCCHDPWHETDMERVMEGVVPDPTKCQVLITGGGVLGCAEYSIMGFYVRNYQVAVVLDAVYSGPTAGAKHYSRTSYPAFPSISLTQSNLIQFSRVAEPVAAGR